MLTTSSREREWVSFSFTQILLNVDRSDYDSTWSEAINGKRNALLAKLPFSFEFSDEDLQGILEKQRLRMVEAGIFPKPLSSDEDTRFRQRGLIGSAFFVGFDSPPALRAVGLRENMVSFFRRVGAVQEEYNGLHMANDPITESLRKGAQLRLVLPILKVVAVVWGQKSARKALAILGA